MRAQLVDGADLAAALDEWEALYAADPLATPFQSAGWARAWLADWAPEAEPYVLLVHDGDRVAGLMALAIRRRGPLRLLGILGQEPGDYWDVLAAPADRAAVRAAATAELARRRGEWDAGILNCLVPGSTTDASLATAGLRMLTRAPVRCPAIALPATFDEYLRELPTKRRTDIRRHLRRLDEGELQLIEIGAPDDLPAALDRWQDLHTRQWDERDGDLNPTHRTERFRAFLLHAVQALAPSGQALVWDFRVAGETAGMYVNFADERSLYCYLGGFDPAHTQLGIGKIATAIGIRQSIEHGRQRYDFTRGAEAYKYWWGATDRHSPSLVVGSGRPRSRAVLAAAAIVNARRERASRAMS